MTLVARHGALTDIGLHRKTNEDTFVVQPPLYAVCDGMGGAQAGEVASELAADTLAGAVAAGRELADAAEMANAAVYERAQSSAERAGMGTTLTALVLEGDTAHFVHIGDSRGYLLRDGELQQVSDDHSLVAEMVRDGRLSEADAAVHPHRSILSRALGTEPRGRIDEFAVDLLAGDVLLLCSDGLSGPVSADAIRAALAQPDPQEAAHRLIREARHRGGPDNITAVVVRLEEPAAAKQASERAEAAGTVDASDVAVTAELPAVRLAVASDAPAGAAVGDAAEEDQASSYAPRPTGLTKRFSRRTLAIVAAVLGIVTAAGIAAAVALSSLFFIGVDNGRLTVYSGLPAGLGPVKLHAVYRRSYRAYDSLTAGQRRLVDAQDVRSKADVMAVSEQLGMWP